MTALGILAYLAAIVMANGVISHFGQIAMPITAFVLIAFDLVIRDVLHEKWRGKLLGCKMLGLIVTGSVLSYITSIASASVSIASAVAFLCAGTVDLIIYCLLDRYPKFVKMNASNLGGAIVDSLLFPTIAFGEVILAISAMQVASKFVGAFFWTSAFLLVMRRYGTHRNTGRTT